MLQGAGICIHSIFLGLDWAGCEAQGSGAGISTIILLLLLSGREVVKECPQTFPKSQMFYFRREKESQDSSLWTTGNPCVNPP